MSSIINTNWDNISDDRPKCLTRTVTRLAHKVDGMLVLREMFPDAVATPGKFILFSNATFNGSVSIEEYEGEIDIIARAEGISFVIVKPQLLTMQAGTIAPVTVDDFEFLKKLRQSSWDAMSVIGKG